MAMQQIATQLFRNNFHQDIWTKVIKRKLMNYDNIVITDCRFPNEIEMIKSHGFVLVHVERIKPSWFNKYKSGIECEKADRLHESEKSWIREKFDYNIFNSSSIEELEHNVTYLYNLLS